MVAVRVAAFLATLASLASLLVGCGGGSDTTPTPAPTKAPTPTPTAPPTPSPSNPPTESWARATCSWEETDGITFTMFEVGCDDKHNQLKIDAVSIVTEKNDLGEQTCETACTEFLAAVCIKGKITNQTATKCACQTERDNLVLDETQVCDDTAKEKTAFHKTTHPQTQKYVKGHEGDCKFSMDAYLKGFENSHPGSCIRHSIADERETDNSAGEVVV